MNFTSQYFADAQKVIMELLETVRPELVEFAGKAEHEHKADKSIVTKYDKQLELKLKDALHKFDGSVGFWGEEHGREGNKESFWLIDPIDGTEEFVRGTDQPSNLLTFISNAQPQYALSYQFVKGDLFIAEKAKGVTRNGVPVHVSDRPLSRCLIEFSLKLLEPDGYKIFKAIRPLIEGMTVRRHFEEIVLGHIDGLIVYRSAGDVWDYAPRALMIAEAGGKIANFGSDKYDYRDTNFIATNPVIFDQIHKILSEIT